MSRAGRVGACVLVLAMVACGGPTGRTVSAAPSITVRGSASLRVPPDNVSVSVGVETRGPTVAGAFDANKRKGEAVVSALRAAGAQAKDVQTSDLEITSRDEDGKRLQGYRVATVVTVSSGDPSAVGALLQAAISAGATEVNSLAFSVADHTPFRNRGLELAFKDAQIKAEALAALSKRTLGDVISVTEGQDWSSSGALNNLQGLGYASVGSMQAGTERIAVSVTVVFELK